MTINTIAEQVKTPQFWDWILRIVIICILPWAVWTTSSIYTQASTIAVMQETRFTENDGTLMEKRIDSVEADLRQCANRTETQMEGIHAALLDIKKTIDRVHPRAP